MSLRRAIRTAAAEANDCINADMGRIDFYAPGDQDRVAAPDPAYPAIECPITDHRDEEVEGAEGDRRGTDFATILPGDAVVLRITRTHFAAGRAPREGDRVTLFDGSRWSVYRVHDDHVARILLAVTPLRGARS